MPAGSLCNDTDIRRLAAILSADVVGYGRLMHGDELERSSFCSFQSRNPECPLERVRSGSAIVTER